MPGQRGKGVEYCIGIVGAARDEEAVETGPVVRVDAGARLQDGVGIGVAGEEDERDASIGAEGGQFVDAILEIGCAADEAEDDEAGMGDGLLQPHVDGEIVGETQGIGETQAILPCPVGGAGQHGQFAVCRGGEDIVAGGLGEVDGLAFLLDGTCLGGEEVHQEKTPWCAEMPEPPPLPLPSRGRGSRPASRAGSCQERDVAPSPLRGGLGWGFGRRHMLGLRPPPARGWR
jgi:hypothetical protein